MNGSPVKEYLAADDRFGLGEEMANDLARLHPTGAGPPEKASAAK